MSNLIRLFLLIPAMIFGSTGSVLAAPDAETAYIFNSFSFLVHGFLVMLMAAGFCMLETGLVRAKNAVVQCAKNIGLYSIAGIMFAVVGYNHFQYGAHPTVQLSVEKKMLLIHLVQSGGFKWFSVQQLHQLLVEQWLKELN